MISTLYIFLAHVRELLGKPAAGAATLLGWSCRRPGRGRDPCRGRGAEPGRQGSWESVALELRPYGHGVTRTLASLGGRGATELRLSGVARRREGSGEEKRVRCEARGGARAALLIARNEEAAPCVASTQ